MMERTSWRLDEPTGSCFRGVPCESKLAFSLHLQIKPRWDVYVKVQESFFLVKVIIFEA